MFPIPFRFDITAVDIMWHNISRDEPKFVRIRPENEYGYFYVQFSWIPKCCFEEDYSWYREPRQAFADKPQNVLDTQPCVWSDTSYVLTETPNNRIHYMGTRAVSCLVLDELEEFLWVRFDRPVVTGEIWIPIADVQIQCPGRTICEFYYGGGEEYYQYVGQVEESQRHLEASASLANSLSGRIYLTEY